MKQKPFDAEMKPSEGYYARKASEFRKGNMKPVKANGEVEIEMTDVRSKCRKGLWLEALARPRRFGTK